MRVTALYGPRDMREEEWPRPDPGPGEVRVKIKAVTICGSDNTQFISGGKDASPTMPVPFVLGHEAAGIVHATGTDVKDIYEGTPVAIDPAMPCGVCTYCRTGRQNICPDMRFLGVPPTHGALQEFLIVPAQNVVPVRAKVSFAEIACVEPLAIALYTMRKMNIAPGDTVAICGAGGIGQTCALVALAAGARVVCVSDPVASRREIAQNAGVESAVSPTETDVAEHIFSLTEGRGVDFAIEAAGTQDALTDALNATARGGRVAIIGIPRDDSWRIPAAQARRAELTLQMIRRSNHTTDLAVEWIERGIVSLASLVTDRLEWEHVESAFNRAAACEEGSLRISLEPEETEEPFYP